MEFHPRMAGPLPDLNAIEHAIGAVDPSGLVDVDPTGQTLRVAASIDSTQLISLIGQAGHPVTQHQVTRAPSI